ncbi:unnamed protein product [Durusdinium trenchii]|uniref:Uncharacterized protein n=3 Tax=Durusdinium trenchii TaxID=1381693 RepID=A0ABP0S8G7_9DINO
MHEPMRSHILMEQSLKKEQAALARDPMGPSKEEQRREEEERFQQIMELGKRSLPDESAAPPPLRNIQPYRLPRSGDRVELCGLRRRAELNGQLGEVMGIIDEDGFVEVQVRHPGQGRLRLRPRCLAPADKTLETSLWTASETSSIRTVSSRSARASELGLVASQSCSHLSAAETGSGSTCRSTSMSSTWTGSTNPSSSSSHRPLPSIWLKQRSKDLSLNYIPTKVII